MNSFRNGSQSLGPLKLSGVSFSNKDRWTVLSLTDGATLSFCRPWDFFILTFVFLLINMLLMVAVIKHLVSILSSVVIACVVTVIRYEC